MDTALPAGADPVHQRVGRLVALADPVADALDDMAALGLHWTRNRERGRMPNGIRAAMLLVAREALATASHARMTTIQIAAGRSATAEHASRSTHK